MIRFITGAAVQLVVAYTYYTVAKMVVRKSIREEVGDQLDRLERSNVRLERAAGINVPHAN